MFEDIFHFPSRVLIEALLKFSTAALDEIGTERYVKISMAEDLPDALENLLRRLESSTEDDGDVFLAASKAVQAEAPWSPTDEGETP